MADRSVLEQAIRGHLRVQLAYQRIDGSVSLHVVAPVDIRFGETEATRGTEYLWAHCYAENVAEMHRCDRIISARILEESFDPAELVRNWPQHKWPLPVEWAVVRSWE